MTRVTAIVVLATAVSAASGLDARQTAGAARGPALVPVSAWVADREWRPATGLGSKDFTVEVAGARRPVRAADFVGGQAAATSPAEGRSLALLVDDLSLETATAPAAVEQLTAWVRRQPAHDRLAVFRTSSPGALASSDRDRVVAAVQALSAGRPRPAVGVDVTLRALLGGLAAECRPGEAAACDAAARRFGVDRGAFARIDALADALRWLSATDGPRAVVLVSSGVALPPGASAVSSVRRLAADAGAVVIGVSLETPVPATADAADPALDRRRDDDAFEQEGLDRLVAMANGRVLRRPDLGTGLTEVDQILGGYYRLGVELPASVKLDPSARFAVSAPLGLVVRGGGRVPVPPTAAAAIAPADAVRGVIAGDVVASDIDLEVHTALTRDATGAQVMATTTVSAGSNAHGSLKLSFGFLDDVSGEMRLGTARDIAPSADGYHASFSVALPPGHYRLRLAVEDEEGHLGSAERGVLARLRPVGPVLVSDVQQRWQGDGGEWQVLSTEVLPTDAKRLAVGIELYPADGVMGDPPAVTMRLEAADGAGPARGRPLTVQAAQDRWRAAGEIDLSSLGEGEFTTRLDVTTVGTDVPVPLAMRFRKTTPALAPPPPPAPVRPTPDAVLALLKQELQAARRVVSLDPVLSMAVTKIEIAGVASAAKRPIPPALRAAADETAWWKAMDTVAADARGGAVSAFAAALVALRRGDATAGEAALNRALGAAPDAAPVVRYLGVVQAFKGHPGDAVGAWQMAGTDTSPIMAWRIALADMMAGTGDRAGSLAMLEGLPARDRATPDVVRRVVILLLTDGRFEDARQALTAAGPSIYDGAPPDFLLVTTGLAFADAVRPDATSEDLTRFRARAAQYLAGQPEHPEAVESWLAMVGG